MSLQVGDRLGPYKIVHALGAGGMGEVYRARDVRLKRDVALKVLPDEHRFDPRRIARLQREAQALAAVNHPNIATLYGVEEERGVQALVMELVEGETLADRIAMARRARRAGLPVDDALAIARQVAEALEAAHEHGIVHRDLKPANVKVRADGMVKVLDFGLASAVESDTGAASDADAATRTDVWKRAGGTPAYMSPEQARGAPVDRRADVWAFGCLLFEMLSGRRAFDGETTADVIAHVIEREPEFRVLPSDLAPAVRRLLQRTLAKDPRNRLHDIADARLELADAARPALAGNRIDAGVILSGGWRAFLPWSIAGVLLATAIADWRVADPLPTSAPTSRFEIQAPPTAPLRDGGDNTGLFTLSPDGRHLAYLTTRGVAIRRLDRLDVQVHEAPELTARPFFSPDGQWIGGFGGGVLKQSVAGGPVIRLAETAAGATGAWDEDGIVFADIRGLFKVSSEGGTPERLPLGALADNEQVAFPEPLPGRRAVLFTVVSTRSNTPGASLTSSSSRIEALDLDTGVRSVVIRGGGRPRYVAGHLLYASGVELFAVPFDLQRLSTTGEPVQVPGASVEFAVSNDGTLVYGVGLHSNRRTLVWVDRKGREEPLGTPIAEYMYPRLSPDEGRVALDVPGSNRDVWIWHITRRVMERFTTDETENVLPTWTPDGMALIFTSARSGVPNLYQQSADGSGAPRRLLTSALLQQPMSFAPDGRLMFSEAAPGRGRDVKALNLATGNVHPLLESAASEMSAEVSPDGRWVAYMSNESGQFEIYVRSFPRVDAGRWKVSTNGGRSPLWSRDGRELFYHDYGGATMAVQVSPGTRFSAGPPATILPATRKYLGFGSAGGGRHYDVSRDGTRFLRIKELDEGREQPSFVVVQNWMTEVTARLRP
jgi:serine/threonine-protein kinase